MIHSRVIHLANLSPVLLGLAAAHAQPAIAQTTMNAEQETLQKIKQYNQQHSEGLNQVNSVFELQDVSPDDWAFQALQNLVERYGCIAGYPDGTFRGNQTMTRYEFAAGLNACLQQIERLIAESKVSPEDLETIRRLQEEYEAELIALDNRVNNLEDRVNTLQEQQFSTTTKLNGKVDFVFAQPFGGDKAGSGGNQDVDENTGLIYQADLNFDASFTGQDRLRVRLRASDENAFIQRATHVEGGASATGNLFGVPIDIADTQGNVVIDDLVYEFPVGNAGYVIVGANSLDPGEAFQANFGSGFSFSDVLETGNLYLVDGGFDDVVSPDGNSNTFTNVAQGDVGISSSWNLTDRISFGVGYTVTGNNARDAQSGIFRDFSLATNLNYSGDHFDIGVGYSLTQAGDKGRPIDDIEQDTIGFHGAVRFSPQTELGGWVTYVRQDSNDVDRDGWGFGANFALKDLGKEGSQLNLGFASPIHYDDNVESELRTRGLPLVFRNQEDRAWLAELSYDFPVNDNVTITPGVLGVFNPNYNTNGDNDDQFVGLIQTSFEF